MNEKRIKNIISDILNEYFQRLDLSKKVVKIHNYERKVLSRLDEEKLHEKLNQLFNDSIIINTIIDDYSELSESCMLKNIGAIEFAINFNSEVKKIKLEFDFEGSLMLDCKKAVFNSEFINENCDIEIKIKEFHLITSQLSDKHHITIFVKNGDILNFTKSNEKWLNSNLFGKDVNQTAKTTNIQKDQLSKNKGCISILTFFV
jgi:hypothetical protein